ncbi:MAG: hypothetical protein CMC48_07100 [Flavobacteriaceae bacterium]|nr:hypothetical protein [Flavobacteriaceae bacterium]|tara:strand:+ start:353 stop:1021 length:669 start_codon:yes stop_codon:yes gene_type:complete
MRIFIISLIFIIFTTNKSFTQNLQTIDTIEVDTISNLKRFSFGIKMGIPNILGLATEAVLPIFKNRVSPYFDYSSFKLNPDKTSVDLNYTDYGVNIYINSKANGLYASFGSGNLGSLILFEEIELTDENGNKGIGSAQLKENINTFNIKLGIKSNSKIFFRLEIGYGIGKIPNNLNLTGSFGYEKDGMYYISKGSSTENFPTIPGIGKKGIIMGNFGFGISL